MASHGWSLVLLGLLCNCIVLLFDSVQASGGETPSAVRSLRSLRQAVPGAAGVAEFFPSEGTPSATAARRLLQVDMAVRSGAPSPSPMTTGDGRRSTANAAFSTGLGELLRMISTLLAPESIMVPAKSFTSADTTVASGVGATTSGIAMRAGSVPMRGTSNIARGSGSGEGSGTSAIGSNRGYTSASSRRLNQEGADVAVDESLLDDDGLRRRSLQQEGADVAVDESLLDDDGLRRRSLQQEGADVAVDESLLDDDGLRRLTLA